MCPSRTATRSTPTPPHKPASEHDRFEESIYIVSTELHALEGAIERATPLQRIGIELALSTIERDVRRILRQLVSLGTEQEQEPHA